MIIIDIHRWVSLWRWDDGGDRQRDMRVMEVASGTAAGLASLSKINELC